MNKIACLFPGQGSQVVGMGKDFFDKRPEARETFEAIDSIAGRSLSSLCFQGPEEELKRTLNTQPTILAASLAAWRAYEAAGGPRPHFVAGHSLGEFSALVAAGSLSLEAAVKLVDRRSRLMEECPPGAMSAVIGLAAGDLEELCGQACRELPSGAVCVVANYNTREQLVISGSPEAVALAGSKASASGARVVPLPVGGAFHSPLMAAAAKEFEQELAHWQLNNASFDLIQNFDARPARQAADLKSKLARQMPSAVRWCATIEFMLEAGVDTFIEIGPGKALAGMVKKIDRRAAVHNIFDTQSLKAALQDLLTPAAAEKS